jgi:dATP pyrophosphohydrolase
MEFKHPVSVLVIIHTPQLEVVLLERALHPGYWQSVTGSQEANESLRATAIREVREETGIIASADSLVDWNLSNRFEIFHEWRHRYADGVTHNTEHVFSLCLPESRALQLAPDEHLAHVWLPCKVAAAKVFSWTNRDAILMLSSIFPR